MHCVPIFTRLFHFGPLQRAWAVSEGHSKECMCYFDSGATETQAFLLAPNTMKSMRANAFNHFPFLRKIMALVCLDAPSHTAQQDANHPSDVFASGLDSVRIQIKCWAPSSDTEMHLRTSIVYMFHNLIQLSLIPWNQLLSTLLNFIQQIFLESEILLRNS